MSIRILIKILTIPGILIGFAFHEYAHALVADRLGDKTPKFDGRLTLNPFVHIDPIGFLAILLVGFGWAKPVRTNPSAFKRYYKDDLKVSIAGPIANLLVVFIFAIVLGIYNKLFNLSGASGNDYITILINAVNGDPYYVVSAILYLIVSINSTLFILNLIPIPGFDGFHVVRDLFPKFFYNYAEKMYKYEMMIFILLVLPILPSGGSILGLIIGPLSGYITSFFMYIAALI